MIIVIKVGKDTIQFLTSKRKAFLYTCLRKSFLYENNNGMVH